MSSPSPAAIQERVRAAACVARAWCRPSSTAATRSLRCSPWPRIWWSNIWSTRLNLKVGEATTQVVLKDLQRHPAKPFILHMDFLRVSQDEKIRLVVPLHFINEEKSKGVKAGGNVSHHITEVEVSCLPKDLPEFIPVDLANMEIGDILHLSQLPLPEGVTLAHAPDPDEPVIVMHGARSAAHAEGEEGAEGA